jgi:hypothetical protein
MRDALLAVLLAFLLLLVILAIWVALSWPSQRDVAVSHPGSW